MKQLVQDLRSGSLTLLDVPAPGARQGHLVIGTTRTLISAGTERMLTSFAKAGYLEKARMQPEKLRQVFDKIRTDGLLSTYESVRARLDQPIALGYCNVGRVMAVGDDVVGYSIGDRVVSNAPHAEVALVPRNLCARIPDEVPDDQASFTVVASIGLQGIRLIAPTIGETIVVSGLGLIGLLAVQILRASGSRVIGFDVDAGRVALARKYGTEAFDLAAGTDPVATVNELTGGSGADAVLITASTPDHELISQCAAMCRKRGRIVLTGVIGLALKRSDFYEKELTFQVSCSYGPGRYDPAYEEGGRDYPLPFVRWTAQRNFEAVLELMRHGRIVTDGLVTDRFPFNAAARAYERLDDPRAIGILLDFDLATFPGVRAARTVGTAAPHVVIKGKSIAVIGAGSFAQGRILPALRRAGAEIRAIVSTKGTSASIAARRFGIHLASTDLDEVLRDASIGGVVIATPHNTHAELVIRGLRAGKHVFVEKPLCISEAELDGIVIARDETIAATGSSPVIMVGFNRRFAPLAQKMRAVMSSRSGPAFVIYTCNAGALPADHWAHDPQVGGGRIIGEACHFVDFIQYLTGSGITSVRATRMRPQGRDLGDSAAITFGFGDGSVGQINYFSHGSRAFQKERCEAAFDGKCLVLENFRHLKGYGVAAGGRSMRQDKGHDAQFAEFQRLVAGQQPATGFPVPFETVESVMRATLRAVQSMRED